MRRDQVVVEEVEGDPTDRLYKKVPEVPIAIGLELKQEKKTSDSELKDRRNSKGKYKKHND